MKRSELKEMIRTAIAEAINEDAAADQAAKQAEKAAIDKKIIALQKTKAELDKKTSPLAEENELDEMANVAVRYELAPNASAANFTGKKARIIATMQATEEPMSKIDVASALGYDKQNPINADFMSLVANGTIILSGTQTAPRLNRPAATEPEASEEETGDENIVARDLSDEEIDATFAKAMKSGEEEPEADEIEKLNVSATPMSDKDYDAFMKYTDLEGSLAKVKSDILKIKRTKGIVGDIADQPSNDLENLRGLKARIQAKMNDLLASSEYLKKRQAKITNKPITQEPKVDDEEEQLDEWVKGRMQYYAGIKK
jgi:hypothetical protein